MTRLSPREPAFVIKYRALCCFIAVWCCGTSGDQFEPLQTFRVTETIFSRVAGFRATHLGSIESTIVGISTISRSAPSGRVARSLPDDVQTVPCRRNVAWNPHDDRRTIACPDTRHATRETPIPPLRATSRRRFTRNHRLTTSPKSPQKSL